MTSVAGKSTWWSYLHWSK